MKLIPFLRRSLAGLLIVAALVMLVLFGNKALEQSLRWYVLRSAAQLLEWEKQGYLSKQYGYVWWQISEIRHMQGVEREIRQEDTTSLQRLRGLDVKRGRRSDYKHDIPCLSAIRELNSIKRISNNIQITDRNHERIATIKSTHTRSKITDLNNILIYSIIYAEDQNFFHREMAYEYNSFVRGSLYSMLHFLRTLKIRYPKGVSTIHQQVAKFLLSKVDSTGFAYIERSIGRKVRELKLAQAIKTMYSNEEILEMYVNHCVSAGRGFVGYVDISKALFNKPPKELDICQSLYLSRLLKWNQNIPRKIIRQCKIDLKRIAHPFGWDKAKQDSIAAAMDRIELLKPRQIASDHGPLIDLANEYWLKVCERNGMTPEQIREMNILNPNSLIRSKGNLCIQLHIDMRLQRLLEQAVQQRGYGDDTVIVTDIRIGSHGRNIKASRIPPDTLRRHRILKHDAVFSEPGSQFKTRLKKGDTIIVNIRYRRRGKNMVRRSVFFYRRGVHQKQGQYFAYAMIQANTGELLAYYSRDQIGSRLNSLIRNRTPNGSAVAKPILHALALDLGVFSPFTMLSDSVEVDPEHPWHRKFIWKQQKPIGMVYLNIPSRKGYRVRNHDDVFDGYDFYFNQLATSNNIIGVETIYRLNTRLYDSKGTLFRHAIPFANLFYRLGTQDRYDFTKDNSSITGVQLYNQIAGIVGADATIIINRKRTSIPDNYYSVALGTLELTLLEQMHLFNALHNNQLIADPAEQPSLFIRCITMSGDTIPIHNTVRTVHLFSDINHIRPSLLGMYKRLTSNPYDRLKDYDIAFDSTKMSPSTFEIKAPLSNFAKSGTTDDVLLPYNADPQSGKKTNYCLWNAVVRLDLGKIGYSASADSAASARPLDQILLRQTDLMWTDVTVACIGEGNRTNTGARDGKTLHKFLTKTLLWRFGQRVNNGYFHNYERYLMQNTPDSIKYRNVYEAPNLDSVILAQIDSLQKAAESLQRTGPLWEKQPLKGVRLTQHVQLQLLALSKHMGHKAARCTALVNVLGEFNAKSTVTQKIAELRKMNVANKYLQKHLQQELTRLTHVLWE